MALQSPYPPLGKPAAGYMGNATPVNVSLMAWIGLCSAGAITNPAFNLIDQQWGMNIPGVGFLPRMAIQDWSAGTVWLLPVNLKWTGTAWTWFNTFYVDTQGKYSYFGNQENGSTGTQYIISSGGPLQPPTSTVEGHLFADLSGLLAIGVGVNVFWNGRYYSCAVSLTQFTPYNNQKPVAKSGAVFPYAAPESGIVTAGTTPIQPYQSLNNASYYTPSGGILRSPFVVQLGEITYTGTTPTGFLGNGQFYFASVPFFGVSGQEVNLLSAATAADYATTIGSQSGPSAVYDDVTGQMVYPPGNNFALVATPNAFGASGYCTWPIFIQASTPWLTTVATWVPVGTFYDMLYPTGWYDSSIGGYRLSPTSYSTVKLGSDTLYIWCLLIRR